MMAYTDVSYLSAALGMDTPPNAWIQSIGAAQTGLKHTTAVTIQQGADQASNAALSIVRSRYTPNLTNAMPQAEKPHEKACIRDGAPVKFHATFELPAQAITIAFEQAAASVGS